MAQPLRRQVALIAALWTVAATAGFSYSARTTYVEQLRQLDAETASMAATVVVYVDQYLDAADAVAATAARHPMLRQLDPRASAEVLEPLLKGPQPLVQNVVLADADGRVVAWAQPPAVEGAVRAEWLKGVAATRHPAMSPMFGGPGDPVHVIVLAYPVDGPGGGVAGVLGISVHLEALEKVLASIPLPEGSVVTLTDEKSVVVARSLDAAQYVGRPVEAPGASRRPDAVPASVVRSGIDGVERVFGNEVIPRGPWLASVGIPTAVAWSRTTPIYQRNFGIALSLTLFLLGLAVYVVRSWLSAFAHMDRAAKQVAQGDLSPINLAPMPSAEMEHLQGTFDSMVTNLRAARELVASQVDHERGMREELLSLQQQGIRQERLAAIGVLVSGVAHELNNPLQAILGFAELLQMQPGMPEQARADLRLIQKESSRASAIIRNLSRFGRQQLELSPVRLRDVVASVMELRQRKLEELGVRVVASRKIHETDFAAPDGVKRRLHYYTIEFEGRLPEAPHLIWLGPADAGRLPFEDDRALLRRLLSP